jgi:hypothetical protein
MTRLRALVNKYQTKRMDRVGESWLESSIVDIFNKVTSLNITAKPTVQTKTYVYVGLVLARVGLEQRLHGVTLWSTGGWCLAWGA